MTIRHHGALVRKDHHWTEYGPERPVQTWAKDILAHFPGARVTYLRSPEGEVVRGEAGEAGVVAVLQEKNDETQEPIQKHEQGKGRGDSPTLFLAADEATATG